MIVRRPDGTFLISQWRPRPLFSVNLWVVKLSLWSPYLFISLFLGWMWREKGYGVQAYLGIKCDGSESLARPGQYWMVLTPRELWAARVRWNQGCEVDHAWQNQAGG
jgi:hypothetical protein